MTYEHLRYEQRGPVTLITIDRPERMNAIGPRTHAELVDAWTRFGDDDAALVGVLTGAGDRAFSAGGDLKAPPVPLDDAERSAHARGERPGYLGPTRWTGLHKPTIAAGNGVAYAGGLEWVCWTDLAIRAQRDVRRARGGARRAHRPLPQPAIRTDHEAVVRGWGQELDEGLRIEAECFDRLLDTPELMEGLRAFNERTHPDRRPDGPALTPAWPGAAAHDDAARRAGRDSRRAQPLRPPA